MALICLAIAIVGIYKGISGWTPPEDCNARETAVFRVFIVMVSILISLVVPLPFWGQRIYGFEFVFYFLGLGVALLWLMHFILYRKSEYWAKVAIAAGTLMPIWVFTLLTPLANSYGITLTN